MPVNGCKVIVVINYNTSVCFINKITPYWCIAWYVDLSIKYLACQTGFSYCNEMVITLANLFADRELTFQCMYDRGVGPGLASMSPERRSLSQFAL